MVVFSTGASKTYMCMKKAGKKVARTTNGHNRLFTRLQSERPSKDKWFERKEAT